METCKDCHHRFERTSHKGRVPQRCPSCRERVKQEWRDKQKEK